MFCGKWDLVYVALDKSFKSYTKLLNQNNRHLNILLEYLVYIDTIFVRV